MKQPRQPALSFSARISPDAATEELQFLHQLGVTHAYVWVRDEQTDAASLRALREKVEAHGLVLYNAGNFSIGKNDRIHLGLDGRDAQIDRFARFLEALAEAGIYITTFTWEPSQVWSTRVEPRPESRGATARYVDMNEVVSRPPTHGRTFREEEIWDNYRYFISRILPVAEQTGVRLALHPNDPPAPVYGGIPSLIHESDGFRRAFREAGGHPSLGMEFCAGCWLEGGAAFGDLLSDLREFVTQKRVRIVHFRNVSAPMPEFTETFLDNGYGDMYAVMKTLVDAGYDGTVTLDHTPSFPAAYDAGSGTAYAIGYMRALLERAMAESGK